jgi:multidrug efflux system membrane fusion protein
VGLGIVLYLFLNACQPGKVESSQADSLPLVKTAKVQYRSVDLGIERIGKLVPAQQIKLSFKSGGIIESTRVQEGQTVRKGQLLAQLKATEFNAASRQTQILLEQQQKEVARLQKLYEDTVVTLDQLEKAQAALASTEAQQEGVIFNLENTRLYAPVAGKILDQFAEANELTGPGSPVYLLAPAQNPWQLQVQLADREGLRVEVGDSARINFDAWPDKSFPARVVSIQPISDPVLGTVQVDLQIQSTQRQNWITGLIGKAKIFPSEPSSYWVLPPDALQEANGQQGYVYQLSGDSLQRLAVEIAHISQSGLALKKGITDSIEVVVASPVRLREGIKVRTK